MKKNISIKINVKAIASAMISNGYYARLKTDRRAARAAARRRAVARRVQLEAAHRRIYEEAVRRLETKKAAAKKAAAMARYYRRAGVTDQIVAKDKARKSFVDKEAARWKHRIENVEAYKRLYIKLSVVVTEKMARVFRATIEGVKALKTFVDLGCKALVTKAAKKSFFDLQRFAEEKKTVEVDVNSADAVLLSRIAGFGSQTVSAILEERTMNGAFKSVEDFTDRVVLGNGRKVNWDKAQSGVYIPVIGKAERSQKSVADRLYDVINNENHELDGDIRRKLMNKGLYSTVKMQSFEAVVSKDSRIGVLFRMGIVSQPASMFTEPYAEKGVVLYDSIKHPVCVPYGTNKVVAVNNSSILRINASSKAERDKMALTFWDAFNDGEAALILADVKEKGRVRRHLLTKVDNEYISLSSLVKVYGKDGKFHKDNAVFAKKQIVKVYASFMRDLMIYSTSQNRQDNFLLFNSETKEDTEIAVRIFNEATYGQYKLRVGEEISAAMAVDLTTRISSHTCGLGMREAWVDSFAILTGKDNQMDGEGIAAQSKVALLLSKNPDETLNMKAFQDNLEKVHGMQLQMRQHTAKATVHVKADAYVAEVLGSMNLLKVYVASNDVDIINVETEENVTEWFMKNLRNLLVKGCGRKSELSDYDGVVVYESKEAMKYNSLPTTVGDRNFWKDVFDVRKMSGLNVVMVPHDSNEEEDERKAFTASQFWKIPRYAAVKTHHEEEFNVISHEYAYRGVDMAIDFRSDRKYRHGFEKVDTSFMSGLLRNINAGKEELHPTLFRGLINDSARRVEKALQLDRYPIAGHVGMFDIDPSYMLLRARDKSEKEATYGGVLYIKNNTMEVYDPVANKFFDKEGAEPKDRIGLLMKYPAINLCESGFVKFLTDHEVAERVAALNISDEDKFLIANEFAAIKEGSVLLPANLDLIGKIWAGSDRDGDKGVFFFRTNWKYDIVAAMQRWGFQTEGVDIHIDSCKTDKKVVSGADTFAIVNAMQAALHNEKVGPVTNASRVLVQPALYGSQNIAETVKKVLVSAFERCFAENKKNGCGEYVSSFMSSYKEIDGYTVIVSKEEQYKLFEESIENLDFNRSDIWEQIIKAAKDFGNLGRHTQEGTIDAAKKFYKVCASFVENLRNFCTITPIRYGVKFSVDWKADKPSFGLRADRYAKSVIGVSYNGEDRLEDKNFHGIFAVPEDGVITVTSQSSYGEARDEYIIPDFFAEVRKDAILYAIDKLNELVDEYEKVLTDEKLVALWSKRFMNASLKINKNQQSLIHYALGMVDVIRANYRSMSEYLTKKNIHRENMSDTEIAKVEGEIRRVLHENFDEMMFNVNNVVRIAGKGLSPETLVDFVAGGEEAFTNPSGRYAGILKEETAKVAISRSENNLAYKKLYGNLDGSVNEVVVEDHEVVVNGELVGIRVNVEDGTYTVVHLDDGAYLTRPLEDFVEIPEADEEHISVMPYLGGYDENGMISNETFANNIGIIDAVSNCDEPVIVTTRRNERGFEQMCLATEKGTVICDLYQGKNNSAKYAMKNFFNGFVGHVENVLYPDNQHLSSAVIVLKKDEKASEEKKATVEAAKKNVATVSAEDMKNFKF